MDLFKEQFAARGYLIEKLSAEVIKLEKKVELLTDKRIRCNLCEDATFGSVSAYNMHRKK